MNRAAPAIILIATVKLRIIQLTHQYLQLHHPALLIRRQILGQTLIADEEVALRAAREALLARRWLDFPGACMPRAPEPKLCVAFQQGASLHPSPPPHPHPFDHAVRAATITLIQKSTASFRERIKVRVIASCARRAHVARAILRAAFEALSENRFQTICCMTLTASRCALGRLSRSGRGVQNGRG